MISAPRSNAVVSELAAISWNTSVLVSLGRTMRSRPVPAALTKWTLIACVPPLKK